MSEYDDDRPAPKHADPKHVTPGRCGCIDSTSGNLTSPDLSHPEVDDVFHDLGEIVLQKRGEVIIDPREPVPTKDAAVHRIS